MEWLLSADIWIAFLTLLLLEIVLGIDNIVFISILAGRLPEHQQARARIIGLGLALISRVLLLFSLSWVIGLTAPLFSVYGHEISGRDIILIAGGLFLVVKATREIHGRVEGESEHQAGAAVVSFTGVLVQIMLLDVVFSLDSVITAVGMVDQLWGMVARVLVAVGIMMVLAGTISDFVNRHPTVKMLALAFLVLIGGSLIADAFEFHIPTGYVYGPIAFSVFVEALTLLAARKRRRSTTPTTNPVAAGSPVRPPAASGPSRSGDGVDVEVREEVASEVAEPRERSERR